MNVRRPRALVTALLALGLTFAFVASGCGGGKQTIDKKFAAILGHQPTGIAAQIAASGTLVIADDQNYAPQSFVDPKTHAVVGFDVDVGRQVCEILGVKPVFKQVVFETIAQGLKNGRFDVSIGSMPVTTEFAKVIDFTAPYYYTPGQIITKTGAPTITSTSDLYGLKVGVGVDTVFFDYLMKYSRRITVVAYPTDTELVAALAHRQIAAAMTDAVSAHQDMIANKSLQTNGWPLYFEPLAFAVEKKQSDLVALLNYAIDKMHKDGSLTKLSQRWYGGMDLTVQ